MKLEIGMYVRTKYGRIGKIINIFDVLDVTDIKNPNPLYRYEVDTNYTFDDEPDGYFKDDIIKASENIIDLIEVGDYVNGSYIQEIISIKNNEMKCMLDSDYELISTIKNEDIETILTKEQFSQMEYKI